MPHLIPLILSVQKLNKRALENSREMSKPWEISGKRIPIHNFKAVCPIVSYHKNVHIPLVVWNLTGPSHHDFILFSLTVKAPPSYVQLNSICVLNGSRSSLFCFIRCHLSFPLCQQLCQKDIVLFKTHLPNHLSFGRLPYHLYSLFKVKLLKGWFHCLRTSTDCSSICDLVDLLQAPDATLVISLKVNPLDHLSFCWTLQINPELFNILHVPTSLGALVLLLSETILVQEALSHCVGSPTCYCRLPQKSSWFVRAHLRL